MRPNMRQHLIVPLSLLLMFTAGSASAGSLEELQEIRLDPQKVMAAEACAKCHAGELKVWQETPHHQTFRSLHRLPEAKQIAERLGLSSIKRSDVCWKCHYTPQDEEGTTRLISGVSCESCHGASRDWISVHSDYGGPQVTREQESPEHRAQRRQRSIELGMRNPSNLYLVARSCLNCHTVPDEKLVNVGGHKPGSVNFELVSWSQGKVRHNFVRSHGQTNDVSSPERLRVMFVVGLMADIEYSLRATGLATSKATFGITSAKRADQKRKLLREIQQELNDPIVQEVVDIVYKVSLKANNQNQLSVAADEISAAAYRFAATHDGSKLGAVDRWLPPATSFK